VNGGFDLALSRRELFARLTGRRLRRAEDQQTGDSAVPAISGGAVDQAGRALAARLKDSRLNGLRRRSGERIRRIVEDESNGC